MTLYHRLAGLLVIAGTMAGCATTGNTGNTGNPVDPFESFNRNVFVFNDTIDKYALKPVATVYKDVTPTFVQTGVYNFFGNIGDVWTAVNNMLQGNFQDGVTDVMRVAVNSTLGFLGVLDIGSEAGLPKHRQDFGVTLGVWGVGSGPFVMLPLLGASTVRDTAALPADFVGDLWTGVYPVHTRNAGSALRVVDARAGVLDASNLIEDAALDRYEFIRDGFMQRRAGKIEASKER
jgi:phospholipid-binding lipoprotein MlaA